MIRDRGAVLLVASVVLPVMGLLLTSRLSGGVRGGEDLGFQAASASVSAGRAAPASAPVTVSRSSSRVDRLPQASPTWVAETAARGHIPAPAVNAYGRAVLVLDAEDPACHLGWTTLAGIGAVESDHGQVGGRTLGADGRSSEPVVGPALNGRTFAAVRATPGSERWHGDPRWDHAVGALQFIPSTWQRWGADGDDDGRRDPNDIDDAALAAARYLCAGGRDLAAAHGWYSAVLSYNHSAAYVDAVRRAALTFSAATGN